MANSISKRVESWRKPSACVDTPWRVCFLQCRFSPRSEQDGGTSNIILLAISLCLPSIRILLSTPRLTTSIGGLALICRRHRTIPQPICSVQRPRTSGAVLEIQDYQFRSGRDIRFHFRMAILWGEQGKIQYFPTTTNRSWSDGTHDSGIILVGNRTWSAIRRDNIHCAPRFASVSRPKSEERRGHDFCWAASKNGRTGRFKVVPPRKGIGWHSGWIGHATWSPPPEQREVAQPSAIHTKFLTHDRR